MITLQLSARMKNAARPWGLLDKRSAASDRLGRSIQIALAFYLLPVLLVVLAIGGLGILIVGLGQFLTGPARGSLG